MSQQQLTSATNVSEEAEVAAGEAMDVVKRYVSISIKKDVSQLTRNKLTSTRIDLVRGYPFLGFLVMSTEYFFTDDINTMAATTIGGNKIYVNEKFINETLKNRAQRAFVIAHECLHIFLEHIGRQTENAYDPQLWNVATDYCINSYLVELNNKQIEMPVFGLYDVKFKGMSSDEIYHKLLEENDNNAQQAAAAHGAGMDPNEMGDGQGGNGNGKGQCPMDEVGKEPMSDAEKIENQQKCAAALGQSDINAIKQMGSGAADLVRAFEDLIDPKIPWTSMLREFVTTSARTHSTYNRISRRSSGNVIFPSMTGDHIRVAFGIDTSGSMSNEDLTEAMTELHSIIEDFDSWEVMLMSCDTEAHEIGVYSSEDGDDWTSVDKGLVGGGGTEMSVMIEYANEVEDPYNVLIIVTDGYVPEEPMDAEVEDMPVIAVVTSAGNKDLKLEKCDIVHMTEYS